ncbi:MAG: tetratricopeptide repeat protein [Flavisolibacter sp.]
MDRIETLKSYLSENPTDNFLQYALALEYIKAGDDGKALELLERLLQNDETYVGSYYHLGKLLERLQQEEKAIATYEKGIAMAKQAGDRHAANELRSALEELQDL